MYWEVGIRSHSILLVLFVRFDVLESGHDISQYSSALCKVRCIGNKGGKFRSTEAHDVHVMQKGFRGSSKTDTRKLNAHKKDCNAHQLKRTW